MQDGTTKILIFSQWSTLLDILEFLLREAGVTHLRLDGEVKGKARDVILRKFAKQKFSVLLINTFAGGQGVYVYMFSVGVSVAISFAVAFALTSETAFFTCIACLIIIRPESAMRELGIPLRSVVSTLLATFFAYSTTRRSFHTFRWNPFVDKQAIGRVDRPGQEKAITAVRFDSGTTIEQVLRAMQADKLQLADYALAGEDLDAAISQMREETMGNLMSIFASLSER